MSKIDRGRVSAGKRVSTFGNALSDLFHYVGLLCLGILVFWGTIDFLIGAIGDGKVTIDEILLMFIFLEIGAMIGIYFKTHDIPVNYLIYIGITALTRYLIGDISHHEEPDASILYPCIGILLLSLSTLAIRLISGWIKPYLSPKDKSSNEQEE